MQVRGEGGDGHDADDEAESSADAQKVVYVLHPNCAIEEV